MNIVRYPPAWQDILDDHERAYETASWGTDAPVIADCPETTAHLIEPFWKSALGALGMGAMILALWVLAAFAS